MTPHTWKDGDYALREDGTTVKFKEYNEKGLPVFHTPNFLPFNQVTYYPNGQPFFSKTQSPIVGPAPAPLPEPETVYVNKYPTHVYFHPDKDTALGNRMNGEKSQTYRATIKYEELIDAT